MAQMYPPFLDKNIGYRQKGEGFVSNAEIAVFNVLEQALNDDWDVFHSVWIREKARGEHSEGDFVLIGPSSVLLLEIKGGNVERNVQGKWEFRTLKNCLVKTTGRGPVDQARDGWYALKDHVSAKSDKGLVKDIVWGYGVITPDCVLSVHGSDPGFSKELWLDYEGFPEKILTFISKLTEYWRKDKVSRSYANRQLKEQISRSEREKLIKVIRPIIGHIEGMGISSLGVSRKLLRLTKAQYKALDYSILEPRVLIQGGAGTGKTLLAIEQARQKSINGERVLFVCFNKLLASVINKKFKSQPDTENITVVNYHQLVGMILNITGGHCSVSETWNEFNTQAPELILNAVTDHDIELWDYLIIDEGQDLLSQPFIDTLDLLLKNGIEEGRWMLCFDPEQALFSNQFDKDFSEVLFEKNIHRISLIENCRNTREISAYGHGIGHINSTSKSMVEGPNPELFYYGSKSELKKELKRQLNYLIKEFRDAGLYERKITVLLARRDGYEEILEMLEGELLCPYQWLAPDKEQPDGYVQVSTVQAFKGLESDAIILIGLESLSMDWQRKIFYVAATRAKSILEVFLPNNSSVFIEEAMPEILRLVIGEE